MSRRVDIRQQSHRPKRMPTRESTRAIEGQHIVAIARDNGKIKEVERADGHSFKKDPKG
jgi:hypothetical protein